MSVVDILAAVTSDENQLELKLFSGYPTAHRVSYVHLVLVPCEGSEPMAKRSGDRRLIRLAHRGNCLVWRDPEGNPSWVSSDNCPVWEVIAERTLINPETGEQSELETSESVQIGDAVYVQERLLFGERRPRKRLLGRARHISTCV